MTIQIRQIMNDLEYPTENGTYSIEYVASKIENEEWAKAMGREVGEYCFSCWDSRSCASPHNEILREREVHC